MNPRRGTLLVIVAGLSAMLATLTLTYLASVRSRANDGTEEIMEAQARILLLSACAFICESRNCGGTITSSGYTQEPYLGGLPVGVGNWRVYPVIPRLWPAFSTALDPLVPQWLDNPTEDANGGSLADARHLANPGSPADTWFRIRRQGPAVLGAPGDHDFMVTVGIGQTYGYASFADASAVVPSTATEHGLNFGRDIPDAAAFAEASSREYRRHFLVRWNDPGAVAPITPATVGASKPYFGYIRQIVPQTVAPSMGNW